MLSTHLQGLGKRQVGVTPIVVGWNSNVRVVEREFKDDGMGGRGTRRGVA